MLTFKQYINEALSLKTAKKYTKMSKGKYKELLNDVFGNQYRIYIPLDIQRSDLKTTPLIKKIKSYIEDDKKIPVEEFDYINGYIKSKKQTLRIGKLLKDNLKLAKAFEQDPLRASKDLQIVISKHPYDIAGMSTDRGWASCMSLPDKQSAGQNFEYVQSDIEEGTIIAYLISNKDKNINNPLSRILIKPYIDYDNLDNKVYSLGKIYGIPNDIFKKRVQEWVDKSLNSNVQDEIIYRPHPKLYSDKGDTFVKFGKKFSGSKRVREDDVYNGSFKWYNQNGELHREDGPAIEYDNGEKQWYLNNQLHREDGPAVERPNGYKAWYKNGKLHREDGPAVENPYSTPKWFLEDQPYHEEDYYKELERRKLKKEKSYVNSGP